MASTETTHVFDRGDRPGAYADTVPGVRRCRLTLLVRDPADPAPDAGEEVAQVHGTAAQLRELADAISETVDALDGDDVAALRRFVVSGPVRHHHAEPAESVDRTVPVWARDETDARRRFTQGVPAGLVRAGPVTVRPAGCAGVGT